MIRNYAWTHNPIFPLYDHWLNPQSAMDRQTVGLFTYRSLVYQETWWEMALLPIRVFFQGQDGSPQYFDGKLNPFLFFLPFFAFYQIKRDPEVIRNEKKIMLTFGVLFFAFAFFSSSLRIRYISPIIPPLVILSIFGLRKMIEVVREVNSQKGQKIGIILIFGIAGFFLWLNAVYICKQYREVEPFGFLSGAVSRDKYIEKHRFEYPAIRYINENLPPDARVLFIFLGNRGYYCDREYIFDLYRNRSKFRQLVRASSDPEAIYLGLKGMEITHLLIRYDIFDKWVKTDFAPNDRKVAKAFFRKYVKLLFFKWGYGVSRLQYPSSNL